VLNQGIFFYIDIIWLSNLSILSVPDEGYSRKMFCALNLISTFLLLIFLRLDATLCTKPRYTNVPTRNNDPNALFFGAS